MLERVVEGMLEVVWINPHLPPAPERAARPTQVEIIGWFEDLVDLNVGLQVVEYFFWPDTLLAAISHREDSTRVLLYTSRSHAVVQERCVALRAVLRPTSLGLRVASEPAWASLEALLSLVRVSGVRSHEAGTLPSTFGQGPR